MARKPQGEETAPDPAYIMLVGSLVNGIILPGFENAEIYPGEPVKVRGNDGINFDHAVKLIMSGNFVWCDKAGTPLEVGSEPQPTDAEAGILSATGADVPVGVVAYPEFHFEDPAYTGPSEVPPEGTPPEQPGILEVPNDGPRSLTIGRTNTPRRETQSEGMGRANEPISALSDEDDFTGPVTATVPGSEAGATANLTASTDVATTTTTPPAPPAPATGGTDKKTDTKTEAEALADSNAAGAAAATGAASGG